MQDMTNTPAVTATLRVLNSSAVSKHALACSAKNRGGKFTRVSESFETEVQADLEALVFKLRGMYQPPLLPVVPAPENTRFVSGAFMDRLNAEIDALVARCIQAKVQRHPSIGCTLKGA